MDIKQLKYFATIVEEGHITGAAKRLFMAQPSLSQQLKLLENELGVILVERGSRRIKLTEAGRLLYGRAAQILKLVHTTEHELKELHDGHVGTLSVGAIATSSVTLLPGLILSFHERYPNIKYQFCEGDTPKLLELLNTGIIEIGIVRSVFDIELYDWVDLPPEPMVVAMASSLLTEEASDISLTELAGKPLLLHRSNESMITEGCHSLGFEPNVFCRGDDFRSLLVWASEGMGFAIVPKSAIGLIPSHTLIYREITSSPFIIKKAIVWLRQRRLSPAARYFLNTIVSETIRV